MKYLNQSELALDQAQSEVLQQWQDAFSPLLVKPFVA
jgi:hypothetical protein